MTARNIDPLMNLTGGGAIHLRPLHCQTISGPPPYTALTGYNGSPPRLMPEGPDAGNAACLAEKLLRAAAAPPRSLTERLAQTRPLSERIASAAARDGQPGETGSDELSLPNKKTADPREEPAGATLGDGPADDGIPAASDILVRTDPLDRACRTASKQNPRIDTPQPISDAGPEPSRRNAPRHTDHAGSTAGRPQTGDFRLSLTASHNGGFASPAGWGAAKPSHLRATVNGYANGSANGRTPAASSRNAKGEGRDSTADHASAPEVEEPAMDQGSLPDHAPAASGQNPETLSYAAGAVPPADTFEPTGTSQRVDPAPPPAEDNAGDTTLQPRADNTTQARTDNPGETGASENEDDVREGKAGGEVAQSESRGGGGGGAGGRLHQRSGDDDFRNILSKGLAGIRRHLITVGIFSLAVNLLVLAIPIYLFQVSDRVLTSRSVDTLMMLTVVVVGALAVHALLDMMRRYLLMRVAVQMETTLGAPVLSAALRASNSGATREFQALIDLQNLRNFVTGPVLLTMFDAPVVPLFMLAVFLIHPHLGLIITTAAGILLVIALINQRLTAIPFARANAYSMRANLHTDAMGRNAQIVNAMGMINESVMMWGRETAEALKAQVNAQDRNILMTGISKFLRLTTQIAMLGWGAYLALDGALTGGMIIAASIVGSRALAPIEGTIEGWRNFVQARSGYARVKTLLQSSPLNLQRLQLPRPRGELSVERVLFVPPPTKKVILNGINFALEPGESMAIVGPSGTGKSTLARMLVGSVAPTSGSVRLDKMDIRNWDPRQFGETIGYLPQDVELFPATIKANIARMREDVSDASIFDAAELAGVHEMISQLPEGYETTVSVDGSPLSGGQKQRIGLARAFFGEPRLVVLDEPNSNLDTAGEAALGAALRRAKSREMTVVTVTQRPALLRSVDRIMIMKDGRVEALGDRDEILPQLVSQSRNLPTQAA